MSIPGAALALTAAEGGGLAFLETLFARPLLRSFKWNEPDATQPALISTQFIVPQITVEEKHLDRMVITEHPIEQGAAITDHAYKMPAELVVRYGWSNSGQGRPGGNGIGALPSNLTLVPYFRNPDILSGVYQQLLFLQADRQLLNVTTGKRYYENMLIESLALNTDKKTENILDITISLKQALIVQTSVVTVAPKEVQATPTKTAPEQNGGSKQLIEGSNFNFSAIPVTHEDLPPL